MSDMSYLAIGHPAFDTLPDGTRALGGTVVYGAIAASRLGLEAHAVLACNPADLSEYEGLLAGIEITNHPTPESTVMELDKFNGKREIRINSWAGQMELSDLPNVDIVHFGPIAAEFTASSLRRPHNAKLVGITMQGLFRQWTPGEYYSKFAPPDLSQLAGVVDVAVVSRSEEEFAKTGLQAIVAAGGYAIVTDGHSGSEVFSSEGSSKYAPPIVIESVDDTGAGDVFAAALFCELATDTPIDVAIDFAQTAAALSVRGRGTSAIASRSEVLSHVYS